MNGGWKPLKLSVNPPFVPGVREQDVRDREGGRAVRLGAGREDRRRKNDGQRESRDRAHREPPLEILRSPRVSPRRHLPGVPPRTPEHLTALPFVCGDYTSLDASGQVVNSDLPNGRIAV